MSTSTSTSPSRWQRLSGPVKIGLLAAALGIALAIVGIIRGNVPLNLVSIFLALLISGGAWGVVAWAVATAAADVDADLAEAEAGPPPAEAPAEPAPQPEAEVGTEPAAALEDSEGVIPPSPEAPDNT